MALLAQPENDDCSGLIDLGTAPVCPNTIYDNLGATASDIGFNNIPGCFNGGNVNRDVWFAFETPADITDVAITLQGASDGPNGSILNPQVVLYRGQCEENNLSLLGICDSAPDGSTTAQLDVQGLTPNTQYFLRINDYTATGMPNSGDFRLCIEELVPDVNIDEEIESTACFGTLFDSGGPDEDYGNNESHTFTIHPSNPFECLEVELLDFQLEAGFDFLNFYAGEDTDAPLIASYSGINTSPIILQSGGPITIDFISDGFITDAGFELSWSCSGLPCSGSDFDNTSLIPGLPYEEEGLSTCGQIADFVDTPCGEGLPFLSGEEQVFELETEGGFCASLEIANAAPGTGALVLSGLPNEPGTICLGQSDNGFLPSLDFSEAGTYYIVVANGQGCTDYDISLEKAECALEVTLENALCNPLNGCIPVDGLPSTFLFEPGFEDVPIVGGVNDGCWVNTGEGGFYWFTIEAQAEGAFGLTFQAAQAAEASDIDFNVWGPFEASLVCSNPEQVINAVENTQPIRSSYAGGADPTGLADIHPITGEAVEDAYDCNGINDDFVRTIDCQAGEVFVLLVNDWGGDILSGAISVDWSASDEQVLAPVPAKVLKGDTAICAGESVPLQVESTVDTIVWLEGTSSLSCTDCFDPVASPMETTTYVGVVPAVCYEDTVEITVQVYDVNIGPNLTLCQGESFQLTAGPDFEGGTYEWASTENVTLSCSDCPAPVITAEGPGTALLIVTLTGDSCVIQDSMQIEILPETAPEYEIAEDRDICLGASVNIGGAARPETEYNWASVPPGFQSQEAGPVVSPDTTTTYFLNASNSSCPFSSLDSVTVRVFNPPDIALIPDTAICRGDTLVLSAGMPQSNVAYAWSGPAEIENDSSLNTVALPQESGTYALTATRGACVEEAEVAVDVTEIFIDIMAEDTLRICQGEEVELVAEYAPQPELPLWTSTAPGFDSLLAAEAVVSPATAATFYAELATGSCFRKDSVLLLVDSLPKDLSIAPADTTVCENSTVLFTSPLYNPANFEEIAFLWSPSDGQESPDSLYNLVITAQRGTEQYQRITTNGTCVDTAVVSLNVDPIPIVSITPSDTMVCPGNTVSFEASLEDAESFEWTQGAGQLSCDDCLDPVAGPIVGSATFTIEGKSGDCPSSASASVSTISDPPYELQANTTICEGEELQLIFQTDPSSDYLWASTDPGFAEGNYPNLTVSPEVGSTTYFLRADNGQCPPVEDEITVEVVPRPQLIGLSATPAAVCAGETVELSAEVDNVREGDRLEWQGPDGSEVAVGASASFAPQVSGDYVLRFISQQCGLLTDTVAIEVLPQPAVELAADTVICQGDSVQLNFASDDQASYAWMASDTDFPGSAEAELVVSPQSTTTYTLLADNGQCPPVEASVTVEVVGNVTLDVIAPQGPLCAGDSATIEAVANGGLSGDQFLWTGSDGSSFAGSVITVAPESSTTYELLYTSAGGCVSLTESLTLAVEPGLELFGIVLEPGLSVSQGENVALTANYSSEMLEDEDLQFNWAVLEGDSAEVLESGVGLSSVTDIPLESGIRLYQLTIQTEGGCVYTAEAALEVDELRIDMPNTFTPNGDGTNDTFNFLSQADPAVLNVVEFKIYNRWGQLIYDNDDPNNGWDGTYNGTPQPSEVYYYYIQVNLRDLIDLPVEKGDVTLLR